MYDPVFKGATRPAMLMGVPVVPLILVLGTHILFAMYSFVLQKYLFALIIATSCGIFLVLMRYITSQDDHRLNQFLLWIKSTALRRNQKHWGSGALSPLDYKKRFD